MYNVAQSQTYICVRNEWADCSDALRTAAICKWKRTDGGTKGERYGCEIDNGPQPPEQRNIRGPQHYLVFDVDDDDDGM